jgi:benzodiazapine receptor
MKRDTLRQVLNVLGTVVTLFFGFLANALPLNGQTQAEISARYPVLFTPAGYVFSIWGLIYIGLIAFSVYQALPAQQENPVLRRIGYWYVASSVANAAWLLLWHYDLLVLSMVAMLGILVSLVVIYVRLGIGRVQAAPALRWCVHIPFSIYLAWVTVATVANVSVVLYATNWGGWGLAPEAWTVIMMLAAAAISILLNLSRPSLASTLVITWSLVGIAARHTSTPLIMAPALVLSVGVLVAWWLVRPREALRRAE